MMKKEYFAPEIEVILTCPAMDMLEGSMPVSKDDEDFWGDGTDPDDIINKEDTDDDGFSWD